MKTIIFVALAAIALSCAAQDPESTSGPGAPSAQSPVPSCTFYKHYRDTLTGNLWQSSGIPCSWVQAGGGGGSFPGVSSDGANGLTVTGNTTGPIRDKGGAVFNVNAYGGAGDARILAATTTATSPTVTLTTGTFSSSDTGKEFVVNSGSPGVSAATYISGGTITGAAGAFCNLTFTGGSGTATGFTELSATNTIAASTPIMVTAFGSGYSTGSQSATLSNGSNSTNVTGATCSGTITVNVSALYYPPQITTITFVDSTHGTMAVNATSSVTSANAAVGTNNDTAVTNALTALNNVGSGTLYFPQGDFLFSLCNFTLSSPTTVEGTGSSRINQSANVGNGATFLYCPSNASPMFTQTADTSTFLDFGLINISGFPTASAGIVAQSAANAQQATFVQRVSIDNWFDALDDNTTGNSVIEDSEFGNPRRYGVLIDNVVNTDGGGWNLRHNNFYGFSNTWQFGSSAIHQNAAGGGKISENNSSGLFNSFEHCYDGANANTTQLQFIDNNCDQVGGTVFNGGTMSAGVIIANNLLASRGATYGDTSVVRTKSVGTFYVGGGIINNSCATVCPPYLVELNGSSNGLAVPFWTGTTPTSALTNLTGIGNVIDLTGQNPLALPVNKIVPLSGSTVTFGSPIVAVTNSSTGSSLNITSTLNSSSGGANITLSGGNNSAFIGTVYEVGATDYWREGFPGFAGSTNFRLRDDRSSVYIIDFPNNTYSGATAPYGLNSNGALLNELQVASARKGTFVCTAGGTITISNTNEALTSDVVISLNTAGGTISTAPAMKTVTAGTGFTVLCGASDTSTYNYDILN